MRGRGSLRGFLVLAAAGFVSTVTVLGSGLVPASASTVSHGSHLTVKPVEIALTPAGDSAKPRVSPGCVLSFPGGGAYVSSFVFRKHEIRAVRINAEIRCRQVSTDLIVQVTLWKTGFIFPHRLVGPTTVTRSVGNNLENGTTWQRCANSSSTTYYGTAFGSVVFKGVRYSASGQSKKVTLACGT
jgi:hypothetical protein